MLLLVYEVEEMFTRRYEIRKHDLVLLFLLGLDYVGGLSYFLFSKPFDEFPLFGFLRLALKVRVHLNGLPFCKTRDQEYISPPKQILLMHHPVFIESLLQQIDLSLVRRSSLFFLLDESSVIV